MCTDFGCYKLDEERFVVRVFGSEYTFTGPELSEFIGHLEIVWEGTLDESQGEDWKNTPLVEPAARKGEGIEIDLVKALGIGKKSEPINRRF